MTKPRCSFQAYLRQRHPHEDPGPVSIKRDTITTCHPRDIRHPSDLDGEEDGFGRSDHGLRQPRPQDRSSMSPRIESLYCAGPSGLTASPRQPHVGSGSMDAMCSPSMVSRPLEVLSDLILVRRTTTSLNWPVSSSKARTWWPSPPDISARPPRGGLPCHRATRLVLEVWCSRC